MGRVCFTAGIAIARRCSAPGMFQRKLQMRETKIVDPVFILFVLGRVCTHKAAPSVNFHSNLDTKSLQSRSLQATLEGLYGLRHPNFPTIPVPKLHRTSRSLLTAALHQNHHWAKLWSGNEFCKNYLNIDLRG